MNKLFIRLRLFLLLFLPVLASCEKEGDPADPGGDGDTIKTEVRATDYIFDLTALPEITLRVPLDEWNRFLEYFDQNPKHQEYVLAHFSFNKNGSVTTVDSVGIRLRGNTSRRRPEGSRGQPHRAQNPDWHHAHFGIHFDEYVPLRRFSGTDRLHLKWFKDDGNYVREIYCYDLFHRFGVWTAPRSSYCRLFIHVEGDPSPAYFGVYQLLESVQDQFVTDRINKGFLTDRGFLWKCTWGADLVYDGSVGNKMGIESVSLNHAESEEFAYDLKTGQKYLEDARLRLESFIRNLNQKSGQEFKQWIESVMDVDLFLRTIAVNVMTGMWDDYWVNQNNYYLYMDVDGKVSFIPFDYDNTLGTSLLMTNSGTQPVLSWGDPSKRPLVNRILAIPEFKQKYLNYIDELCDPARDLFDPDKSITRIILWQNRIKPYLSNDTGEDMSIVDRPASWANAPFYRLLSGNEKGGLDGNANWFRTRKAHR